MSVVRVGPAPDLDLDLNLSKAWELRNAAPPWPAAGPSGSSRRRAPASSGPLGDARAGAPAAGGGTLIEDCYNANPIAMQAALADLAGRPGRRVAVLADMKELGPTRPGTTARSARPPRRRASTC